ncbi:catechol 2,3-dioxygenase [Georgenia satyanarayanai]|uniref:Catechol 2,3-dioxygenase n=1 Tax=Georgenia satyanarayanai TaxID=860221 RepID=A0A2Y9BZP4_9MICO|nr:VOC family protein [Georgenia satyanarayanai]PYF98884.1 catechol 2,3-dioxygenase [Georgenia satyanarayanai]SSA44732.1 catechol 2,3-dioxygenase [Georgenia satyanarayanai]
MTNTATPSLPGTNTRAAANRDLLAADTEMGPVTLLVGDLDLLTRYYVEGLALTVLSAEGDETVLGRGSRPLVVLRHDPSLPRGSRRDAGLFHTAILFEDAAALASAVASLARLAPQSFVGSSDHLVSEAFYFTDPEGNGIELYLDRPRDTWRWTDGQVAMDTIGLDPNAYLGEHLDTGRLATATTDPAVVGHVHLQVGDTTTARRFYVDTLGFEATFEMPSALFVSAGGYHHHMAMNTWNSAGAGPRVPALGLGVVDIVVPDAEEIGALTDRLRTRGWAFRDDGRTLEVEDPWRNLVRVVAAAR